MPSIIKFCKRNNEMVSLLISCRSDEREGQFPTIDCISLEDFRKKIDATELIALCSHIDKEGCLIGELVDLEEFYREEKNKVESV